MINPFLVQQLVLSFKLQWVIGWFPYLDVFILADRQISGPYIGGQLDWELITQLVYYV